MAKNLKLKDLTYGVCNSVEDSSYDKSFDRRRTDALTYLQTVISDYYTPDTLQKYDIFRGVVVKVIEGVPRVTLADPQGKIDTLATPDESGVVKKWWERAKQWLDDTVNGTTSVYKVYIPELEMRPAPTSENDPVIDTYYDVLLDDNFDEERGLFDSGPSVGQIVTVRFTDLNSFYDPRIISVGKEYNLVGFEKTSGKAAHDSGVPSTRADVPTSPAGSKKIPEDAEVFNEHLLPASSKVKFFDDNGKRPAILNAMLEAIRKAAEEDGVYLTVTSGHRGGYDQTRVMLYNYRTQGGRSYLLSLYGAKAKPVADVFDAGINASKSDPDIINEAVAKVDWLSKAQHSFREDRAAIDLRWGYTTEPRTIASPQGMPPQALSAVLAKAQKLAAFDVLIENDHYHISSHKGSQSKVTKARKTKSKYVQAAAAGGLIVGTSVDVAPTEEGPEQPQSEYPRDEAPATA